MENAIYEQQTIDMIKHISSEMPVLSKWKSEVYGEFIVLGIYPIISDGPAVHVCSNSIAQFTFYEKNYKEVIKKLKSTMRSQ